jgi:DNA-directed RNA polymerase subunit RPC12/RpoP
MAELIKCMECGGMVSSEANQCPHCKTGYIGIRGVNCHACGGLLKVSEAIRHSPKSPDFHNSCYQQISRQIIEKKQTINCPVCAQPNQFSYGKSSYYRNSRNPYSSGTTSRSHNTERINCAKCGHPYEYKQIEANDPYEHCKYCDFLLEKNLELKILDVESYYYAHKICNNKERQAKQVERNKYFENQEMMKKEEEHKWKRKRAKENANDFVRAALIPILLFVGFCVYIGGFWTPFFFVFLAIYLMALMVKYFK